MNNSYKLSFIDGCYTLLSTFNCYGLSKEKIKKNIENILISFPLFSLENKKTTSFCLWDLHLTNINDLKILNITNIFMEKSIDCIIYFLNIHDIQLSSNKEWINYLTTLSFQIKSLGKKILLLINKYLFFIRNSFTYYY